MRDSRFNTNSAQISRDALAIMANHDIDRTPFNYEIWYNYVLGDNQALVTEISDILNSGLNFDVTKSEQLYQKYFGSSYQAQDIQATCSRIEASVSDILKQIGLVRFRNTDYRHKLEDINDGIPTNIEYDALSGIIKKLADETASVIQTSQVIELKITESSENISELNHHLEELRHEVLSDNLTGLANRKFFEMKLREEISRMHNSPGNLCLIFVDVDDFKKFNDSYGHLIGDEVLKVTSNLLKDNIKGQDLAARYGGEEFCILLPDTDLKSAVILAKQIGEKLASREINNKRTGETYGRITLSMGVAEYVGGESSDEFIGRADHAHYTAKRNGRNRVEIASTSELESAVIA